MFFIYIIGNEVEITYELDEKLRLKADVVLKTSYVQEDDIEVIKKRRS